MQKWIVAGAFLLSVVMGAVLFIVFSRSQAPTGTEMNWDMLAQLDYVSGQPSAELKALDRQQVRIPGYMVPLEDSQHQVTEFLLVPTPQACIHVPPPPPNQMVYVKMRQAVPVAYGPIWAAGVLSLTPKKHMYGESSFEMDGTAVEAYR